MDDEAEAARRAAEEAERRRKVGRKQPAQRLAYENDHGAWWTWVVPLGGLDWTARDVYKRQVRPSPSAVTSSPPSWLLTPFCTAALRILAREQKGNK